MIVRGILLLIYVMLFSSAYRCSEFEDDSTESKSDVEEPASSSAPAMPNTDEVAP